MPLGPSRQAPVVPFCIATFADMSLTPDFTLQNLARRALQDLALHLLSGLVMYAVCKLHTCLC